MATEVIVIVEDQDARVRLALSMKVCGREATDPSPDDDQIVDLGFGFTHGSPIAPAPMSELVGCFEGTDVISPPSRTRRRIDRAGLTRMRERECLVSNTAERK